MQKTDGDADLININTQTDAELLLRVSDYDTAAFEQLYDRYSSLLFSLIKKIVNDNDAAENILAEVFITVSEKINDFDFGTNHIYTWLVTLSRNKAFDFLKRKYSDAEVPEYNEEYERLNILPKLSNEIIPIELNAAVNIREEIGKAVNGLTDAQKYVLMLLYFEGLNETEIAQKLNIPVSTVKTKLKVAVETLLEKTRELITQNG